MSIVPENPCLACTENQRCCSQLSGLTLSNEEFEKNFRKHTDKLSVVDDNKVFIVSAYDNGPCPHWQQSGCKIYYDRPIDCRVYPYEIIQLAERKGVIEIKFRGSPCCPQKDHLLIPLEDARTLMKNLGRMAYGESKPIVIKYVQEERGRAGILALFDPLMAWLFKVMSGFRKNG